MLIDKDHRECKMLITEIERKLPEIDGIKWDVSIYTKAADYKYSVNVQASFDVGEFPGDRLTNDKNVREISEKIHQILSYGQVKLELE